MKALYNRTQRTSFGTQANVMKWDCIMGAQQRATNFIFLEGEDITVVLLHWPPHNVLFIEQFNDDDNVMIKSHISWTCKNNKNIN